MTDTTSKQHIRGVGYLLSALVLVVLTTACSDPEPALIPWPTSLHRATGELTLTPASRLVAGQFELQRLVPVVTEEVRLAAGLELQSGREAGPGDILLQIDSRMTEEQYGIEVDSMAVVRGGSYGGVALGTTTLLQAMHATATGATLPRMAISDAPHSAYRGLMVDLARQWHTIETLQQIVVMCRLYKIRYLHLHLTDNQSFTFPSQAYPELATPGRHYTVEELRELERFASDRGVILVPELDIPGHSYSLVTARPDIFGISQRDENPYVINMGREQVYTALDRIIGEIANVFRSSPYIHIGGDETWLAYLDQDPDAVAFMRRNDISDVDELYRYFIVRVNDIVKQHGKQTIVWEGFHTEGAIEIPRDILVMAWETAYQLPQDLLNGGYTIINVSWKPLYVVRNRRWSPEYIYGWNMYRWENWYRPTPSFVPIQLEPNDNVIGGQMAAWEQADVMEVPSLRHRLPVLSERIWKPQIERGFADFASRLAATDWLLQHLIRPATVQLHGQKHPGYVGPFFNRENWFHDTLTLSVHPLRDDYRVFFATDTAIQLPEWPRYSEPLQLTETTALWLRVESGQGEPVGFPWRTDFEFRPLTLVAQGLADPDTSDPASEPSVFHNELNLTLRSARAGGTIRFSLDGEPPSLASPVYREPIVLRETATLTAQLFDRVGIATGDPLRKQFRRVEFYENITTGKQVTTSQGQPQNPSAQLVVDGMVDRNNYWGTDTSGGTPWLQIDLGERHDLSGAELFTYWDGERHYRYTIELSIDGQSWTQVVDASANTTPATEAGYRHQFAKTPGRFVRVTMLENSANSWVHIVELWMY